MTQLRRNIPTALGDLLDSETKLVVTDLVSVLLSGSSVPLLWSGSDSSVTVDSEVWSLGPGIRTGRLKWSAGLEVDTLPVTLYAGPDTLVNGHSLMPFINGGGLDGAVVNVWRAFAADPGPGAWPVWVGKLLRISGKVSDIDRPSRVEAVVTVRSVFELLDQQLPRNVCQPSCLNSLYDSTCGIVRSAVAVTGALTTSSDAQRLIFTDSGNSRPTGHFDLGTIRFTSGANTGVMRTVRQFTAGGQFQLVQPLPVPAAPGDAYVAQPGCDLSKATCTTKFSNVGRFRGMPFIPVADSII